MCVLYVLCSSRNPLRISGLGVDAPKKLGRLLYHSDNFAETPYVFSGFFGKNHGFLLRFLQLNQGILLLMGSSIFDEVKPLLVWQKPWFHADFP
jgi:hypothetical protein